MTTPVIKTHTPLLRRVLRALAEPEALWSLTLVGVLLAVIVNTYWS